MAGLSAATEVLVLNTILTGVFVSLHTADPGDSGASEVSGGSYVRQSVAFANAGSNPTIASNNALVQFPAATAAWGMITHFGLWTAATAGSYRGAWPVAIPKIIDIEDVARWNVGALKVSTDDIVVVSG